MYKRYAHAKVKLRVLVILSLALVIIFLLSAYPPLIERLYSNGIYIGLSHLLRILFNFIPFSLGDVLYLFFICWIVYGLGLLIMRLIKWQIKPALNHLLRGFIIFQSVLLLFYGLWGMNYFRQPASKVLHLPDTSYTLDEVKTVSKLLIDSLNSSRSLLPNNNFSGVDDSFAAPIKAMYNLKQINSYLNAWRPYTKPSLFTPLLNYMGTSGYTNPFTGEAQINNQMPIFDRPVTACHEMAHQLGFAREDEANFVGFLAASHSTDKLLRYSGYYLAAQEFLLYLRRRDSVAHRQFRALLSAPVKADFKTDSIYWTRYEGKTAWLTGKFYNQFLKANNQPAGLHTYNRMIVLTIAYYKSINQLK